MCEGFGCVAYKDQYGNIQFAFGTPNRFGNIYHSEIINELEYLSKMRNMDGVIYGRKVVHIEFPLWHELNYHIDEISTLPIWFDPDEQRERVTKLMLRVKKHWDVFKPKFYRLEKAKSEITLNHFKLPVISSSTHRLYVLRQSKFEAACYNLHLRLHNELRSIEGHVATYSV